VVFLLHFVTARSPRKFQNNNGGVENGLDLQLAPRLILGIADFKSTLLIPGFLATWGG